MRKISGIVATSSDKDQIPLQAADLLAGQATMQLRGHPIEEPYKCLAATRQIHFTPLTENDPIVLGYANIVSRMNVGWSTKLLEKFTKKNHP